MHLRTENLGKRFGANWIFRELNLQLDQGKLYSITGPNGSGKSTLLQIIAGITPASRGNLHFFISGKKLQPEDLYKHLAVTAPYLELPEELTLREFLSFHFQLKPVRNRVSIDELIEKAGLSKSAGKQIRFFSSGMKQRIKLLLVFYSDVPLLLLDEPTSNLDKSGIDWYRNELENLPPERLILIFSNQLYEYEGAENILNLAVN